MEIFGRKEVNLLNKIRLEVIMFIDMEMGNYARNYWKDDRDI